MKPPSLRRRLRYAFDNSMSAGPIAMIGWLALLSLLVVLVAALACIVLKISPAGEPAMTFVEAGWRSLMRTLDSGTMGGDEGWSFRIAMLVVTLGGIFIVSTLIGVLTSGIEQKLDELRKGRSFVIETQHTLILGWSSQVFSIISELVIANANQRKPRIVILADKDKVEMEDEIRAKVGSTGKTKVICRSGSPIDLTDLAIVNPQGSKSIIILTPEGSALADAQVIKIIVALINNPERRPAPYHIVAEIQEPKNMQVAQMVGGDEVALLPAGELISRITVQTCRQAGLSVVYTELLDFDGDEIYFQEEPQLVGKTFEHALSAYEDCTVMGLRRKNGAIELNPTMQTKIESGDKIIAIAEDDDCVRLSKMPRPPIEETAIRIRQPAAPEPERTLILGWNARGSTIVTELDRYVAPGSKLAVVASIPDLDHQLGTLVPKLQNQKLACEVGDTTDRVLLDHLRVNTYQHVILLCYSEQLGTQEADAKTLMTLLHLRDIEQKHGEAYSVVSEMLDVRNRALAQVTQADDFIVSDKLTSLMLAQVSENKELVHVFENLFNADGSELYLKPVTDYVATGIAINFYTVTEAAKRCHAVAVGYRLMAHADNPDKAYGVVVNPKKSDLITFSPDDKVILLAEN